MCGADRSAWLSPIFTKNWLTNKSDCLLKVQIIFIFEFCVFPALWEVKASSSNNWTTSRGLFRRVNNNICAVRTDRNFEFCYFCCTYLKNRRRQQNMMFIQKWRKRNVRCATVLFEIIQKVVKYNIISNTLQTHSSAIKWKLDMYLRRLLKPRNHVRNYVNQKVAINLNWPIVGIFLFHRGFFLSSSITIKIKEMFRVCDYIAQ